MRILHTMLRTGDLDRSIDFYTQILGMQLMRRQDYPMPHSICLEEIQDIGTWLNHRIASH